MHRAETDLLACQVGDAVQTLARGGHGLLGGPVGFPGVRVATCVPCKAEKKRGFSARQGSVCCACPCVRM